MRNCLSVLLAITVLAGCGNSWTPQPRRTDDDPKRIAEDAAHLPQLQFAKATTRPIAIRYQEDRGNRIPSPDEPPLHEYRAVHCAIWEDGLVLWRQNEQDVLSPLFYARLDAAATNRVIEKLGAVDQRARALKMRSYVVPDGGQVSEVLSLPGVTPILLSVWREDDYVPSEDADAYKAMMDAWNVIKETMRTATPASGQPVSPDDVVWLESDGRKGVRKP